MYVGWDWASETHDVTVIDGEGSVVEHWSLRHEPPGIDAGLARPRHPRAPGRPARGD